MKNEIIAVLLALLIIVFAAEAYNYVQYVKNVKALQDQMLQIASDRDKAEYNFNQCKMLYRGL